MSDEPAAPQRSDQDIWREKIGHAIAAVWSDLEARRSELADLKVEYKTLKDDIDDKQADCTELESQIRQYAFDMKRVDDGTYTPPAKQQALPFSDAKSPATAPAGTVRTIADGTRLDRLHPEPVADDGRVKQCIDVDCLAHTSRGIYVDGACPSCGNTRFWCMIDPTPEPAGDEPAAGE